MKVEKVMINGKGYYHYRNCKNIKDLCARCCFVTVNDVGLTDCMMPFKCEPYGYYIRYNEKPIESCDERSVEISNPTVNIAVPQPPEGSNGSHIVVPNDQHVELKADKVKREGAIGKRSYYAFPNGVEAEDICRYLPFNLGNVVKYACRAGRKDAKKKIEDLQKARDYLDNEIKRLEEGDE